MKDKKPAISISMLDFPGPAKKEDMGNLDEKGERDGESEGESDAVKPEALAELEKYSDEELMAEMERRGLSSQMSQAPEAESEAEDSEEEKADDGKFSY